ncbi:lipopolysaccharide biosynthesis protein [Mesorhizobium sp. M1006]|uniref:lipopolysaccharide biosynthesis protein n=1 Tax=Mesorhizobium sp. M1006 TaxID=2957048 RepID=UPI003336C264
MSAAEGARNAQLQDIDMTQGLGRRTAYGGILALASQLTRIGISLVSIGVMARVLQPSDFGLVAIATTITAFAMLLQDMGLSAAVVQPENVEDETLSVLWIVGNIFALFLFLLIAVSSPMVSMLFADKRIANLLLLTSLTLPLTAIGFLHRALLQRWMRWTSLQGISLLSTLASAVVAITLVLTTDIGYWALAVQSLLAAGLQSMMYWFTSAWRPKLTTRWRSGLPSLRFGLFLTVFSVINYAHRYADNLLIGWRFGTVELGYYSRAYAIMSMPLQLVNGPAGTAIIASLSRLQSREAEWRQLYMDALLILTFITAPLASFLIFAAPELITIVLGPNFTKSIPIFMALSIGMFAQPVMSSTGWLWISTGNTKDMAIWAAFSVPLLICSMGIGLLWGASGVALAYSATFTLLTPLCTVFSARRLPISTYEVYHAISWPILGALVSLAVCSQVELPFPELTILALVSKGALYSLSFVLATTAASVFYPVQRRRLTRSIRVFFGRPLQKGD